MRQIIDLSGKKILITGASSGIGRATAILLSQVGATVALVARDEERLRQTLSSMDEPSKHACYSADLLQLDNIEPLIEESVKADGQKFDGFVHCAGVAHTVPLKLLDYTRQDEDMRVNYYAFIEFAKQLSKKKYGTKDCSLVGISSIASYRGGKCQTVYSATKAAMDAAVVTLSKELADKGVRINSIRPGMIRTELSERGAEQKGLEVDVLSQQQVLGLGKPEDVANMAAFLLSPAARFITGQNISVDGGGPKSEWF